MAPDHPWVDEHPDYFVHGSEADLARSPQNYCRVTTKNGPLVLAYGRDPYFDGWPDTLQLNYGNPAIAASDDRRAGANRRPMRRRALRHGHARPARSVRTDLGHPGRALLAEGDRVGAAQASRLPVHGRGLLGHGMDAAAAGLRLHLRQAPVRPACASSTPAPCASISARTWTIRTSWRAFWRTTTSRGRQRRLRPQSTRRPRS